MRCDSLIRVCSGSSWWKWSGGLWISISGWTSRILALAVFNH